MINEIDKEIRKHQKNSRKLKEIYLGEKKISYEKSLELQEQQNAEWKKTQFLKKLKKELIKQKGE